MDTQQTGKVPRAYPPALAHLEWKRLLRHAKQLSPALVGQIHNFCVRIVGEPSFQDCRVRIQADILAEGTTPGDDTFDVHAPRGVLLILKSADWPMVNAAMGTIKFLQAHVQGQDNHFILDCTNMRSVLVTASTLRDDTTLRAAELFGGGFAGWSQAAFPLHRNGVPIHMAWTWTLTQIVVTCLPAGVRAGLRLLA